MNPVVCSFIRGAFNTFFSIAMNNNVLTNMNDILLNMVFMWLDILDLLPRQCSYTLAVEGWTALPEGLFHNQRCLIVINIRLAARHLGAVSIRKTVLSGMAIPIEKCSCKTVWTVSIDKPVSCIILSMPIIRYLSTTWWTFWTFFAGHRVVLRPEWRLSFTSPLRLLNSRSRNVTVA